MEKELLKNAMVGCAVGHALGWPYEFGNVSQPEFRRYYNGTEQMEITDDTQMSLFTLEGNRRGLWGLRGKPIPPHLWGRVKEKNRIEDFLGWVNSELGSE